MPPGPLSVLLAWLDLGETGGAKPKGRLPFDVPRSMSAVEQNLPDVPFDTVDPLFHFGHGLSL